MSIAMACCALLAEAPPRCSMLRTMAAASSSSSSNPNPNAAALYVVVVVVVVVDNAAGDDLHC
jgi:hypothetical protein